MRIVLVCHVEHGYVGNAVVFDRTGRGEMLMISVSFWPARVALHTILVSKQELRKPAVRITLTDSGDISTSARGRYR